MLWKGDIPLELQLLDDDVALSKFVNVLPFDTHLIFLSVVLNLSTSYVSFYTPLLSSIVPF